MAFSPDSPIPIPGRPLGGYSQPLSAKETGSPSPMTKWSSTRMSTRPRASFRRVVRERFGLAGLGHAGGMVVGVMWWALE
jgi:hypothetical protein